MIFMHHSLLTNQTKIFIWVKEKFNFSDWQHG